MMSGPCLYKAKCLGLKPRLSCMKCKGQKFVESVGWGCLGRFGADMMAEESGEGSMGVETWSACVVRGRAWVKHLPSWTAEESKPSKGKQAPLASETKTPTHFVTRILSPWFYLLSDNSVHVNNILIILILHHSALCPAYSPLDLFLFYCPLPTPSPPLSWTDISHMHEDRDYLLQHQQLVSGHTTQANHWPLPQWLLTANSLSARGRAHSSHVLCWAHSQPPLQLVVSVNLDSS